jgi:DNA-binding NarL/FixJ family response regulator
MGQVKVLLADGLELFREGLSRILDDEPGVQIVSKCASSLEAVEKATEVDPDVVLIDVRMKDAIGAARHLVEALPGAKVAVLTESDSEQDLLCALEVGAKGYLTKDMSVEDIVRSIHLLANGKLIISPVGGNGLVGDALSSKIEGTADDLEGDAGLSSREIEVVQLVAEGDTNRQISEKLVITENTAKVHMRNILRKLQLRNKQQLAAFAIREDLAAETEHGETAAESD